MPPDTSGAAGMLDRVNTDVVLIVDDVPDNLSVLHDALDESGFTVLLATSGESALQRAKDALPDIVLLDAMMPGMDGFAVARALKADPHTAHIPIIFMTGLTDTQYLVTALESGGVDYVTKPIKPKEVLARMAVHLAGARERRQARNALDAFGYASIAVRVVDGHVLWQTPLARALLERYFENGSQLAPKVLRDWLAECMQRLALRQELTKLTVERGAARLVVQLHQQIGDTDTAGDWLIVMRESSDAAVIEAMRLTLQLTTREAEVLYWVVKGKTNRDIGEILGSSPMTVKKHLERVFVKVGVETRTAAAGVAMGKIQALHPQFVI